MGGVEAEGGGVCGGGEVRLCEGAGAVWVVDRRSVIEHLGGDSVSMSAGKGALYAGGVVGAVCLEGVALSCAGEAGGAGDELREGKRGGACHCACGAFLVVVGVVVVVEVLAARFSARFLALALRVRALLWARISS